MPRATLAALVLLLVPATAHAGPEPLGVGPLSDGVLGYRSAAGDFHAVGGAKIEVRGGTRVITWATNGPGGAPITVRETRLGKAVVRFRVEPPAGATATRVTFSGSRSERFYGLGERSDHVGRANGTVENYVSDGPFPSPEIAKATIPPQGFRDRRDATYYPVPWLLSGFGYGVLLDDSEPSAFTLHAKGWTATVEAAHLDFRLFGGPRRERTPAHALALMTRATGRQPAPDTSWQYGPWLQTGQPNAPPLAEQKADLAKLRAADAPVSAAETQLRYLPCGLDRGNEAYERRRVGYYHRQGLAVLTYVNPQVCRSYQSVFGPAQAAGALQQDPDGGPALIDSFVGGAGAAGFSIQPVSQFDFTAKAGRAAYGSIIERLLRTGHDGWMEDFGEYTPLDAVSADRTPGLAMHNRYPTDYHCAVRKLTAGEPIVRFQRSGWTGAARCASDVWGGDPTTRFGFDGLSSAVKQALSIGLSGVSRWGSDIGGYDTLGDDPKLTVELLKRWIEFGAVSGVMRIKKSGLAIPGYERPQIWDEDVVGTWRRYAKLHTQLLPYLAAADRHYRRTGIPLMRALLLGSPHDGRAARAEDEYGFGPDLLAAPVVRKGRRARDVYLPKGRWTDGLRYDARTGGYHVRRAPLLRGRRSVHVKAPLGRLPLFVRAGAVIPMLTPDVETLSPYGKGHVVRLADRRDRMRLLAFPEPVGRHGRTTVAIAGPRRRTYTVEVRLAHRPRRVTVRGRGVAFRYRAGVLTATVRARRATLVAQ